MESKKLFRRAIKDTLAFFQCDAKTAILTIGIPVCGAGFDFYRRGADKMLEEIDVLISWTLGPLGGFVVLLFFWNLWLTPYRMTVEAQNTSRPQKAVRVIDFEPPIYSHSDARDRFTLVEAACLWANVAANVDPVVLQAIPEAMNCYMMLSEAIEDGDLPCFTTHKPPRATKNPEPAWRVYRKDLLALAEKKDVKPMFLYRDSRDWRI